MDERTQGKAYEAVTLDLFGTLLDFRTIFNSTLKGILVDHDLMDKAHHFHERWRLFAFMGTEERGFINVRDDFKQSLVRVLRELGVEGDLQDYTDRVLDQMFDSLHTADLFPEVPMVLRAIEDAGIPWGVVSNVDEVDLRAVISHHGLRPTAAVSSERVVTYKPEPLIFQTVLEEMGGPEPHRVIHSGDTPIADVAGASSVGLDVLWLNRYVMQYPDDLPRPTFESANLDPLPKLVLEGQF